MGWNEDMSLLLGGMCMYWVVVHRKVVLLGGWDIHVPTGWDIPTVWVRHIYCVGETYRLSYWVGGTYQVFALVSIYTRLG